MALSAAMAMCLVMQLGCKSQESEDRSIDYVTETRKSLDFGKTAATAYTPEIGKNMNTRYEDKFGMFVHWGSYAQLEESIYFQNVTNQLIQGNE